MSDPAPNVTQFVSGSGNIFSGTGDVYVINWPLPLPAEEVSTRKDLRILLNKVKTFWVQGILEKSVHAEALLDLGKQISVEMVDHPWRMVLELPEQNNQILPPDTKIIDIFEQTNRALLILGDPGSGKTTTLIELARDLISRAESDDAFSQPVPVVLSLSTWGHKQETIEDWIVAELSEKYGIPKSTGRSWLENHRILPLLDGLDEVRPARRAACVGAINNFGEKHGLAGLAVCSRLQDYIDLPVRLKLNGAVSLQPLSPEQVDNYLAAGGNKLKGLRAAMQVDIDLQSLARSPLMLSIMSLAYQDVRNQDLPDTGNGTLQERREHLFGTYTERMFERKGQAALSYSSEQTKKWLAWLARKKLTGEWIELSVEGLQPGWSLATWQTLLYVSMSALPWGIFVMVQWGLIWGVLLWAIMCFAGGISDIRPFVVPHFSWEAARKDLRGRLKLSKFSLFLISLFFLPIIVKALAEVGLIGEPSGGPLESFWQYIAGHSAGEWILFSFAGLLVLYLSPLSGGLSWQRPEKSSVPLGRVGWRLPIALIAGSIGGLGLWLANGPTIGLFFGLLIGWFVIDDLFRHFVLRLILYLSGRLPWNYDRFLRHAADRIYLRKVGRGYIFIHRLLMEHFAKAGASNQSSF